MMTRAQRQLLDRFLAGPADALADDALLAAYVQDCRDEHKAMRRDHETTRGRARYVRAVTRWARRYRIGQRQRRVS